MNKAFQYALCLLKFRLRSEYELNQRLRRRGFAEPSIKEALFFLKDKGLIDDLQFARAWVESRLRKPLGFRRLEQELKVKGINRELISRVLGEFRRKYKEEELIEDLVCRRKEKLKHIEPEKAKRRIFSYLLRRGFSSDIVKEVINKQ